MVLSGGLSICLDQIIFIINYFKPEPSEEHSICFQTAYIIFMTNNRKHSPWPQQAAIISLLGLIAVSLAWELWLAPLRPGGSWLALKALPLCLALTGILKGKVYTFQWSCMLVLAYFAEAVVRLFDAEAASRWCAAVSLLLSMVFFVACLVYVKQQRKVVRHG